MASRKDTASFKYGQPLFAAAWPRGETLLVAGGGGKAGSGIENRIIAATFTNGVLSDEIACVRLKQACEKIAVSPTSRLLLAAAGLGITPFDIHVDGGKLSFVAPQVQTVTAFEPFADQKITALAFSTDGRHIVLGTSTGRVHLWAHKGLAPQLCKQLVDASGAAVESEVKDVDVSPHPGATCFAATVDAGDCYVVQHDGLGRGSEVDRSPTNITRLAKPKDLANATIRHCRFSRTGRVSVLCSVNYRGNGYVCAWRQQQGTGWTCTCRSRRLPSSITGLDISPDGRLVAACTSEGEVYLLSAASLAVMDRNRKAHMIFGTGVVFAQDGHAFVSISADASARVTRVQTPSGGGRVGLLAALLVLLVLVVAALAVALPEGADRLLQLAGLNRV